MQSRSSETRKPYIDADQNALLNKVGNAVFIIDAPGNVRVETSNGDNVLLSAGRGHKFADEYSWIRLTNEGAAGLFEIIIGYGDYIDAQISGEVSVQTASSFAHDQVAVGVAAVQVVAGNADRKKGVLIKALSTNTGLVYVGNSNAVTVNDGYELAAGESVTVENDAVVWAIADAAAQAVCYIEE